MAFWGIVAKLEMILVRLDHVGTEEDALPLELEVTITNANAFQDIREEFVL